MTAGESIENAAPMSRARYWSAVVLCLAGIAILLNLGAWQVERLTWKEGIVRTIDARIHAEPRPVAEIARLAEAGEDIEYIPVTVRGRFLHDGERYFLSTHDGEAGWHVYTPLALTGAGDVVFVNRGFVPYALKDPATRPLGQAEREVEITGLARNAQDEKPGGMVPDNDPAQGVFFWKNIDEMAQGLDLESGARVLPLIVDAGPGAAEGGYPIGGVTVIDIPNNHLQYAITWFSLAFLMAGMLVILVVTQWRRRRALTRGGPVR